MLYNVGYGLIHLDKFLLLMKLVHFSIQQVSMLCFIRRHLNIRIGFQIQSQGSRELKNEQGGTGGRRDHMKEERECLHDLKESKAAEKCQ